METSKDALDASEETFEPSEEQSSQASEKPEDEPEKASEPWAAPGEGIWKRLRILVERLRIPLGASEESSEASEDPFGSV